MSFGRNFFITGTHQILTVFVVAGERVHGANSGDLIELGRECRQELAELAVLPHW